MAQDEIPCARAKKRRVGFLDKQPVYFVGSGAGFYLAVESTLGGVRRLSDAEHLRFKQQSRIEDLPYGRR